jgi:hypothetical protein
LVSVFISRSLSVSLPPLMQFYVGMWLFTLCLSLFLCLCLSLCFFLFHTSCNSTVVCGCLLSCLSLSSSARVDSMMLWDYCFGLVVIAECSHACDPSSILGRDSLYTFGCIPQCF